MEDHTSPIYVVRISDNVTSVLSDIAGSVLINVSTPDIIDCDETRTFWVSWQDRIIGKNRHIHKTIVYFNAGMLQYKAPRIGSSLYLSLKFLLKQLSVEGVLPESRK